MRLCLFLILFFPALAFCAGSMVVNKGGSGSVSFDYRSGGGSANINYETAPSTAPSCVGSFFQDSFTESGTGTMNLSLHSPTLGGIWDGTDASDGSILLNRSNDEINSSNTGGVTKIAFSNLTADCSNYAVTGNAKTGTTGSSHRVGVLGRWLNTSGGNGYRFRIEGDGTARLERVVNGTATDLDTDTVAGFSASTYYDIELRMNGTTIQGYVGGVLECSATDSTHTSNGSPGILLRNGNIRMTSVEAEYL